MAHHRNTKAAVVLALLTVVATARFSSAQTTDIPVGTPTTVPLASGGKVSVSGGNGYVLLKKGTTANVVVSVVKSKLAADVPVTMMKTATGIAICAVYPSKDPKKPHACGSRIYEGNPKDLPEIGITVELPDRVAANASMGAGEVRSTSVTGDVVLFSDRGTVTAIDGGIGAITASVGMLGNIQASLMKGGPRRDVQLNSPGMGRVRVVAPRDMSLRYSVATQGTPRIDPAFGIKATKGPLIGSTSPLATDVDLKVDTGIAGEFVLQQPAAK